MLFLVMIIIGLPLCLVIYVGLWLLKLPVTLEESAETSRTISGFVLLLPFILLVLIMVVGFASVMLTPFAAVAWAFHASWLPSFLDTMPVWLGVPSFVWIGALLAIYWVVLLFQSLRDWLRSRGVVRAPPAAPR
jgi:hypothetical protein